MGKRTVLITGCSRGIGLALVKEFISKDFRVFATCREPEKSKELRSLLSSNGLHGPIPCNVSSDSSIESCRENVSRMVDNLDILINNAGISNEDHPDEPPSKMRREEFLRIMNTNVAGSSMMIRAFLPLLLKSEAPKVINISSRLASIVMAQNVNCTSYRCSKSALNMLTKVYSIEYPNIAFVSVQPGWVQTGLGKSKNQNPPVTVAESSQGIVMVAEKIGTKESGNFVDFKGETYPF